MRTERGFTLLEVLVAFAIASLALGVWLPGMLDGLRSARASGGYEEAVARARSHLAALDGRVTRLVPGERQGDDGGGFRWHSRIEQVGSAVAMSSDPNAPPGSTAARISLYAISVTISWAADGQRQVTLNTERVALEGASP